MRLNEIRVLAAGVITLSLAASVGPRAIAQAGQYTQTGDIQIGGPLPAQWDYQNVDSANKKLYVSHGNAEVVVIDTATEKVVKHLPDMQGVHGIAFAENGKGFISNGRGNNVTVFDLKSLEVLSKTDATNPDAITYEPKQKEIYAFSNGGKLATVVNSNTGAVVTTIPLAGNAETGRSDPGLGRVFVNIEDKSSIDVIDVATHKVVDNWSVAPGANPTGMAIDPPSHRIFVGTDKFMEMIDTTSGKIVASVPICTGTDSTWYDPATKLAFSSCRDGKITVAHVDGPDKMTVVQTIATATGSRTMALDPVTHKVYVAAAKPMANAAAPTGGRGRVQMDPESFHVLVFSMGK